MGVVRSLCNVIAVVAIAVASVATPAAASTSPIRPNQHYIGLVNGKHAGAVIYVACPGPIFPGRTGAVVGNQTVAVRHVRRGVGYTGSFAQRIWAQFGSDAIHVVGFTSYNVAEPIPTSLQLPCQGTGTVTFTTCFGTLPCAADTRPAVVPVTFLNIAV